MAMRDKERLIVLIQDSVRGCARNWAEVIADYLLANGVIVPPCKVGDTVYAFSDTIGTVLEYFVENLNIAYLEENRNCYTYEANCNMGDNLLDSIDFDFDDIGKTVFLTLEEAEQALKGGAE